MPRLILVLGGARSGKSRFAERLAATAGAVLYVATAQALDAEMAARIAVHRARRPAAWRTVEAALGVADAIGRSWQGERAVLLEDLALLTSNVLLRQSASEGGPTREEVDGAEAELNAEIDTLLAWLAGAGSTRLIAISQEVGLGLVPANPLGRAYRDLLGRLNQRLARQADHAYLVVAGWAVDLRQAGIAVEGGPLPELD